MRAARHTSYALAALLAMANATAQTTYPDCYIQNVDWTSGDHFVVMPQAIYSPGDGGAPASSTGAANTEFVSATQIRLMPGFHAGDLTGDGRFRARINPWMGDPEDLVVIAPDPTTHIENDILHVEKWEKLEIGYKLPQDYQDAIGTFFANYYPFPGTLQDPNADHIAAPGNTDATHDLNPYADDSLRLVMTLIDPSGDARMKWGFYMKQGKWSGPGASAVLVPELAAISEFTTRFRISPDEEGLWQFGLSVKAPLTLTAADAPLPEVYYTGYSFVCDPPLEDNHGHLQVNENNRRMLQFRGEEATGDETPFFGLGVNMSDVRNKYWVNGPNWHQETFHYRDYDYMKRTMVQLHEVGGNFMRMFLMRNIFAPEWVNLGVYDKFKTPQVCDQTFQTPCNNVGWTTDIAGNCQYQCWAFDQMLDHARANDIYIQLCIDPYPPIIDYERFLWGAHPYAIHFVEPEREIPPDPNPYDLKRFFYSYENPDDTQSDKLYGEGAFYYWKRKYKYIMSRWGYSVNLPIIEPFNEIDQMLSYHDRLMLSEPIDDDPCENYVATCMENRVDWLADEDLPDTYDSWLTDLIGFVKGTVEPWDPVHSPLGETNKMFLAGTGKGPGGTADPDYYLPSRNSKLDLIDVHTANTNLWDVRAGRDDSQWFWNNYTDISTGEKRPFRHGEYSTYGPKDILIGAEIKERGTYPYFANYDVSFHNELWASAFFGNFTAGTSWCWERVFWWPDALEPPLDDDQNIHQNEFFNGLGDWNQLDDGTLAPIDVQNRQLHHHFKPLSDFLSHPGIQFYNFFGGDFSTHRHSNTGAGNDESKQLECYWLLREPYHDVAIGWVHNMNAYWDNSWYMRKFDQELLDCTSPLAQSITLSGFAPGDHHISYFPTRMNTAICPADDDILGGGSTIELDLDDPTSAALNCVQGSLLDTLHGDYAFIITPEPLVKSLRLTLLPVQTTVDVGWDFSVYPNPAHDEIYLQLPDNALKDIVLHDLAGRQVGVWYSVKGPVQTLPVDQLAKGAYWVRVFDKTSSRTKKLIVH